MCRPSGGGPPRLFIRDSLTSRNERGWGEALEARRVSWLKSNALRQVQQATQLVADRAVVLAQVDTRNAASGCLGKAARRPSQTGPHVEYVGTGSDIENRNQLLSRLGTAKMELVYRCEVIDFQIRRRLCARLGAHKMRGGPS